MVDWDLIIGALKPMKWNPILVGGEGEGLNCTCMCRIYNNDLWFIKTDMTVHIFTTSDFVHKLCMHMYLQ